MPRPRDSQKSKVFAVEQELRQTITPGDYDLLRWTRHLMQSAWMKRRIAINNRDVLEICRSSAGQCMFEYSPFQRFVLNLGEERYDKLGVIHAFSHLMANTELTRLSGTPHTESLHGRTFARCFLELVKREWGNDTAKQLRSLYSTHKVKRIAVSEETREKRRASWEQRQIVEAKTLWADFIQEKEEP